MKKRFLNRMLAVAASVALCASSVGMTGFAAQEDSSTVQSDSQNTSDDSGDKESADDQSGEDAEKAEDSEDSSSQQIGTDQSSDNDSDAASQNGDENTASGAASSNREDSNDEDKSSTAQDDKTSDDDNTGSGKSSSDANKVEKENGDNSNAAVDAAAEEKSETDDTSVAGSSENTAADADTVEEAATEAETVDEASTEGETIVLPAEKEDSEQTKLTTDDGRITVSFDADAFSEDVEMKSSSVDQDDEDKAEEAAKDNLQWDKVHQIDDFDLTFASTKTGESVEPSCPVTVTVKEDSFASSRSYYVVHLSDNNDPEFIDDVEKDDDGKELHFELKSFSPVVIFDSVRYISDWKWVSDDEEVVDKSELHLGDEKEDAGDSASSAKLAKRFALFAAKQDTAKTDSEKFNIDYIVSKLPKQIKTTIDGKEQTIDLTWKQEDCDYHQNKDGSWPQSGSYTFKATLSGDYTAEKPLTISVSLGDDVIAKPGLNVSVSYPSGSSSTKETTLTEDGVDLDNISRNTSFNLHISGGWPDGAKDKSISISYAYGLGFASLNGWDYSYDNDHLSHSAKWYTLLKSKDGMITPYQNGTREPGSGMLGFSNGTLTLNYKDETDAIDIVDPNTGNTLVARAAGGSYTYGLENIGTDGTEEPAIKVVLSYTLDGSIYSITKKLNNIQLTPHQDHLSNGLDMDLRFANKNSAGQSRIVEWDHKSQDIPQSAEVAFYAHVMDDQNKAVGLTDHGAIEGEYLVLEAPSGTKIKEGAFKRDGSSIASYDQDEVTLPDGTTYQRTISDREVFVISCGKGIYATYNARDYGHFNAIFSFPDNKAGNICKVSLVKSGVRYRHTDKWLTGANTVSQEFLIVPAKENVFVNANWEDETKFEGTLSSNPVFHGAAGIEDQQEWILGGINIGNRGTGDSSEKQIDILYDPKNTNYCGVTEQVLPYTGSFKNIHDMTVVLIQPSTGNKQTITVSKEKLSAMMQANEVNRYVYEYMTGRGAVQRKDFTQDESWYLKEITFKVDTIKARSTANGSTDNAGIGMTFMGNVLKIPEGAKGNQDFYAKITIKDVSSEGTQTENQDLVGKSLVTLVDKYAYSGIGVRGSQTFDVGQKDVLVKNLFVPVWINNKMPSMILNKIYLISPYGDTFRDFSLHKGNTSKEVHAKLMDNSKLNLPKGFDKAKVYEVDLDDQLTDEEKKELAYVGVTKFSGKESASYKNDNYNPFVELWYKTDIAVSDPAGNVGNEFGGLVYAVPEYPKDMSKVIFGASHGEADQLNLTGNSNAKVVFHRYYYMDSGFVTWHINATDGLTVSSSMKMTTEPDSAYRTWNGKEDTYVGANNDLNYRVTIANTSNKDVKGTEVYVPIPKKSDIGWNGGNGTDADFIQNDKGKFEINTELTGPITSVPEGYTVQYAIVRSDETSTSRDAWKNYDWKSASGISSGDWAKVNFVKITNNGAIAHGTEQSFNMVLHAPNSTEESDGYTEKDITSHMKDIWAPFYTCLYGTAQIHGMGEPVATILAQGELQGKLWDDRNRNGEIDDGEQALSNREVKLYLVSGSGKNEKKTLNQTVKTDKDGQYLFKGLLWNLNFEVETDRGDTELFTSIPDDDKNKTDNSAMRFSVEKKDEAQEQTAATQTVTTPDKNGDNIPYNMNLNCGFIRTTDAAATVVWDDHHNQDGMRTDAKLHLFWSYGDDDTPQELTDKEITGSKDDIVTASKKGILTKVAAVITGEDSSQDSDHASLEQNSKVEWKSLPAARGGRLVVYSLQEDPIDQYETKVLTKEQPSENNGYFGFVFKVVNKHTPELITVSGEKTWNDGDAMGTSWYNRPDSIDVILNGAVSEDGKNVTVPLPKGMAQEISVTDSSNGNWQYAWKNVYKYWQGKEVSYTVSEVLPKNLADKFTVTRQGYSLTNTPVKPEEPAKPDDTVKPDTPSNSDEVQPVPHKHHHHGSGSSSASSDSGSTNSMVTAQTAQSVNAPMVMLPENTPYTPGSAGSAASTPAVGGARAESAKTSSGSKKPSTGDESMMAVWGVLVIASAAGLAIIVRRRQRMGGQ